MSSQPEPTKRAHVYITGRVQGVSFRWHTQRMAQKRDLTGWVRNLWDGRVEAVFEGPATQVAHAVTWCRRGDPPARVDHVQVIDEEPTGEFKSFRITW